MTELNRVSDADIDAILADDELDLEALEGLMDDVEEEEAQAKTPVDEDSLDDLIASVESEEARMEGYEKQNVSEEPDKVEAKKKPAVRTVGKPPSEQIRLKLGEKYKEVVVLTLNQAEMEEEERVEETEAFIDSVDDLPKKVGEKVVNILQTVNGTAKLSVYTELALKVLKEKGGECATEDIRKCYLAHPYSVGTSSAQSSQMMKLLPALKICTREGNKLKLNEDSVLLPILTGE